MTSKNARLRKQMENSDAFKLGRSHAKSAIFETGYTKVMPSYSQRQDYGGADWHLYMKGWRAGQDAAAAGLGGN